MTVTEITSNLSDNDSKDEFRTKTYEMLSKEFQELLPKVSRAYQLISLMYNRLTLIENLSHKEARLKIINDHKNIPGFSDRNVRRYWPSDNPKVPHRVTPSWPKSSITQAENDEKLNILEQGQAENTLVSKINTKEKNVTQGPVIFRDNLKSSNVSTSNQRNPSSLPQTERCESTSNSHVSPECEKLAIENSWKIGMLEDALTKATSFSIANEMYVSQSVTSDSIYFFRK